MPRIAVVASLVLGTWLLVSGCAKLESKDKAIDYFVKGKTLLDAGDSEAALAELGKAVKVDSQLSIAYATMGDIYRHQGNWEQAKVAYESACQTNPFAFRAHYNLGVTYQALAAVAQVAEKVKEYLAKAVTVYLRAITLSPDDFDSNLNISVCYFQLGQMDEAEKYCRAAIQIDPNNAVAYYNLGTIKESQNDLYDAIRAYKASLEQDPNQPDLLLRLGMAYMNQNRLKAALQAFQEAARQMPTDSAPWEKMGACYFYLRDFGKAQESYARALELNPAGAVAHRGMGVAYMAQFIMDRSRTDLRDKGLEEWHASLDIQPGQEDLRRLIDKYTPPPAGPKL
jgi:tetratricopeptide (TPR) repeat protein